MFLAATLARHVNGQAHKRVPQNHERGEADELLRISLPFRIRERMGLRRTFGKYVESREGRDRKIKIPGKIAWIGGNWTWIKFQETPAHLRSTTGLRDR